MPRNIRATKTEQKNGWDNTRLRSYILEREQAARRAINQPREPELKVISSWDWNPHDWQP
jgi:hypothetical protein